jgi:CHASE1-domain containing sensor protein
MAIQQKYIPKIILFLFILIACGSILRIFFTLRYERDFVVTEHSHVNNLADASTQKFISDIEFYIQVLYGVKGLMYSNPALTRSDFHHYVNGLDLSRRVPGASALFTLVRVSGAEKPNFIAKIKNDTSLSLIDNSKFKIWPESEKDQYFPITYNEPANMSNIREAIGYDYASEPSRLLTLEKAISTNRASMSDPISAVITKADSFFLILPIFDQNKPFNTPEERRDAATGGVVMGFRSAQLFNSAFELYLKQHPNLTIKVYDGQEIDPSKLVYDSNRDKQILGATTASENLTEVRTIESAGRFWTLEFSINDAVLFPPINFMTVIIMNSLILLTAVVGIITSIASIRHSKV